MINVINKRERGRPRAFDRDVVIDRAMRVFWAEGYEGASMPMLTAAMGISAQSLYAAFGSKEALYRETIELYRTTIGSFPARALAAEPDAVDAVAQVLHDAAVTFARSESAGCMMTHAPTGTGSEPLVLLGRELRAEGLVKVAERLERGVAEGQVRADTDCAAWARYVATMVQGLSVQARDGVSADQLAATAAIGAEALRSIRR